MNEPTLVDRTHNIIVKHMIETGQAPHYTEIAAKLDVPIEEGRKALRALLAAGVAAWVYPGTDLIVSYGPFNSLPNEHRITIDGQQKWFGSCAFESLACCWYFPGKTLNIDSICLDCGKPIHVEIRDGKILNVDPKEVIGFSTFPRSEWHANMPVACGNHLFFRSEEHVRNWADFTADKEDGIIPLSDVLTMFSADVSRRRLDPDYVSQLAKYRAQRPALIAQLSVKTKPFWTQGPAKK